ncbi:uncharacterized protein METZ01_LOCUS222054 [marine metagenome]|uniref:Uncharacterized protein n=1 Tax=marine metagenome TaxID=408172 RepID=A0A382G1U1_9ZZZZ
MNSVAGGGVDMSPDAVRMDGRTKGYRIHRRKLEAARQKREARLKNKAKASFTEKVKGKMSEMGGGRYDNAKPVASLKNDDEDDAKG